MTKIAITDTTLRDGHQSLLATRMRTDDMLPIASKLDSIGYQSMEVWGGATFDVATRFLGEDPWERLKKIKNVTPNTPLQMLLRGKSLVGYKAYSKDVIETFVKRSSDNGIEIFRVFDALNDEHNLTEAAKAVAETGSTLQIAICYSVTETGRLGGPIFNLEYYVGRAKLFQEMGADSLCIKDMAGLLAPYDAYDLFSTLKKEISIPIQLHSHYTSGMASMASLKAIEAGCNAIDTALAPLALRTSQPAIEPMVMSLKGTENDLGFDLDALIEIGDDLEKVLQKYQDLIKPLTAAVIDTRIWEHQIPGGMISNLVSQLRDTNSLNRLPDVLKEIPKTRRDLGYPPLVTPMSQMVATQSVSNTLAGKYQLVSEEIKNYLSGKYGRPIVKPNPDVIKKIFGGTEPFQKNTGKEDPDKEFELQNAKKALANITDNIDDILIYAIYPVTGLKFLKIKHGLEPMPDEMTPNYQPPSVNGSNGSTKDNTEEEIPPKTKNARKFNIYVGEKYYQVEVDSSQPSLESTIEVVTETQQMTIENEFSDLISVKAPMPGLLLRYKVDSGQLVQKGDDLVVLESMKMEVMVPAPSTGSIQSLNIDPGTTVKKGQTLTVIAPSSSNF